MIVNNDSNDSNSFDFAKKFKDLIQCEWEEQETQSGDKYKSRGLSYDHQQLFFNLILNMLSHGKKYFAGEKSIKYISGFTLAVLIAFLYFVVVNNSQIAVLKENLTEKNLTNVIAEIVKKQLKENEEINNIIKEEAKNESIKSKDELVDMIVTEISEQIDQRVFGLNKQLLYPYSYKGRIDLISDELDFQPLSSGRIYNPNDNICTLNIAYDWKMSEKELRFYQGKFIEISIHKRIGSNKEILYRKQFAVVGGVYRDTDHPERIAAVSTALAQVLFQKGHTSAEFAEVNLKPTAKKKSW